MTARVLVVEDEADLLGSMVDYLRLKGFDAHGVGTANALRVWLAQQDCHVIVLDLGLPDMDGLRLMQELALAENYGLVLATARGGVGERIAGFEHGADAYLVKPIALAELGAVVANVTRRVTPVEGGRWRYDPLRWMLHSPHGPAMNLTRSEALFIEPLIHSAGEPVPRHRLIKALGCSPDAYDTRRLETLVRRLRGKAQRSMGQSLPLTTARGHGYAFTAPVEMAGSEETHTSR